MEHQNIGRLQPLAKAILKPFCSFAWRIHIEGEKNVPRSGGALLAPNHLSALDSLFVPFALRRRITYVGKAEYLDEWKTRILFPALGMIPLDRSGGESSTAALDAAADVLDRGELFGIYPEGTRSRDGLLHKGHTGVARLAMRTMSPIIPVGVTGSIDVQPPDARFPSPFHEVTVKFGEPIDVSRYADRASDRLVLRQITDEVMYAIRELTHQEYSHTYATKAHSPMSGDQVVIAPTLPVRESVPASVDSPDLDPPAPIVEEPSTDPVSGSPEAQSSADVLNVNEGVQLVELG